MRTYTPLTQGKRHQIWALLKAGHSQYEIASILRLHRSTISREVRRNRGGKGYRPAFFLDRPLRPLPYFDQQKQRREFQP